eukprot:1073231-Rhodomonas_salina.2
MSDLPAADSKARCALLVIPRGLQKTAKRTLLHPAFHKLHPDSPRAAPCWFHILSSRIPHAASACSCNTTRGGESSPSSEALWEVGAGDVRDVLGLGNLGLHLVCSLPGKIQVRSCRCSTARPEAECDAKRSSAKGGLTSEV